MIMETSWQVIIITFLVTTPILSIIISLWRSAHVRKQLGKFPGPPQLPIIGIAINLFVDPIEFFNQMLCLTFLYGKQGIIGIFVGTIPYLVLFKASAVETVLSSNIHISKSRDYNFLHTWLGTGLLTSSKKKWKSRRKLLTPSFHFRILENFISVFNEQSNTLVKHLSEHVGKEMDIFPMITNCALDVICDSAMGQHVDAQGNGDSEYVTALERIKVIIHERQMSVWYWPDWIFNYAPIGREHARCLKILHSFTDKVISEKKSEWKSKEDQQAVTDDDKNLYERKHRQAFLDLLLDASDGGKNLSNQDIREEVDTFMFEGHDTTAAAISWAIYLLGSYPKIQEKVQKELYSIFGSDFTRPATENDLKEMKYLDCVIKETLRLFPSVPLIGRELEKSLEIDGVEIPKGVTVVIVTYLLHRDRAVFPNPDIFDPERFQPENCHGRHPFAYTPFSAGPRNCIGQKFALMEQKVILSRVLRSFDVCSLQPFDEIDLTAAIILRPSQGIKVQLTPRIAE